MAGWDFNYGKDSKYVKKVGMGRSSPFMRPLFFMGGGMAFGFIMIVISFVLIFGLVVSAIGEYEFEYDSTIGYKINSNNFYGVRAVYTDEDEAFATITEYFLDIIDKVNNEIQNPEGSSAIDGKYYKFSINEYNRDFTSEYFDEEAEWVGANLKEGKDPYDTGGWLLGNKPPDQYMSQAQRDILFLLALAAYDSKVDSYDTYDLIQWQPISYYTNDSLFVSPSQKIEYYQDTLYQTTLVGLIESSGINIGEGSIYNKILALDDKSLTNIFNTALEHNALDIFTSDFKSETTTELLAGHLFEWGHDLTSESGKYGDVTIKTTCPGCYTYGYSSNHFEIIDGAEQSAHEKYCLGGSSNLEICDNGLNTDLITFMGKIGDPSSEVRNIAESTDAYTIYEKVYEKAKGIFDGAKASFVKGELKASTDASKSVLIRLKGEATSFYYDSDYVVTFGDSDYDARNIKSVISNLFRTGSRRGSFEAYKAYVNFFTKDDGSIDLADKCDLNYECVYDKNGAFIFPLAIRNQFSNHVLGLLIMDTKNDYQTIWINDFEKAEKALTYNLYGTIHNNQYCWRAMKLPDTKPTDNGTSFSFMNLLNYDNYKAIVNSYKYFGFNEEVVERIKKALPDIIWEYTMAYSSTNIDGDYYEDSKVSNLRDEFNSRIETALEYLKPIRTEKVFIKDYIFHHDPLGISLMNIAQIKFEEKHYVSLILMPKKTMDVNLPKNEVLLRTSVVDGCDIRVQFNFNQDGKDRNVDYYEDRENRVFSETHDRWVFEDYNTYHAKNKKTFKSVSEYNYSKDLRGQLDDLADSRYRNDKLGISIFDIATKLETSKDYYVYDTQEEDNCAYYDVNYQGLRIDFQLLINGVEIDNTTKFEISGKGCAINIKK